jgi:hypothetical protein
MKSPILFLVFNRPDVTKRVFLSIKNAKPPILYIASDGPRLSEIGERDKVEDIRSYLLKNIDWNCEVKTLFRDNNLGCKVAVSEAINWFFKSEKEGIILEDDCLPSQSFFDFCEDMLEKYRDDLRVWHISGNNFQNQKQYNNHKYYFSKIPHIWGWATWSNRWDAYDVEMRSFDSLPGKTAVSDFFVDRRQADYWLKLLENHCAERVDAWDFQWSYTCFINNGLSINPNKNMVTNIGFGVDATHTKFEDKRVSNLKSFDIQFPIDKMKNVSPVYDADAYTMKWLFYKQNIIIRMINKIKRLLK